MQWWNILGWDVLVQILFYCVVTGFVTSWLLYRRLTSGIRTEVRVQLPGGTEKRYNAVEVGHDLMWVQDGEDMNAKIPVDVLPCHTDRFGVRYRVWYLTDGADEVVKVPWLDPNVHAGYLVGDEGAKERYRRRVRALKSFKQISAGLSQMGLTQMVILILLGFFAGMWFAPVLMGAIGG